MVEGVQVVGAAHDGLVCADTSHWVGQVSFVVAPRLAGHRTARPRAHVAGDSVRDRLLVRVAAARDDEGDGPADEG